MTIWTDPNDKNRSLKSVENDLNLSIILTAIFIFFLSLVGHIIINSQYSKHKSEQERNDLVTTLAIYNTNLLSRLQVIVSATEFLEFIRSGQATRDILRKDFVELMSRIPKEEITGWLIRDKDGKNVFSFGKKNSNTVAVTLCYLGDVLNAEYGVCAHQLNVFLDEDKIYDKLKYLNPKIVKCDKCRQISEFPKSTPELFKTKSSLSLKVSVEPERDEKYLYFIELISLFGLITVVIWARNRVRNVIRRDIIDPIVGISSNGGSNVSASTIKEIVDFRYQKQLLLQKAFVEESERKRLANEIHDMYGSLLVKLKWGIARLENKCDRVALDKVLSEVDELISATHQLIESLRPEVLDTLGFTRALELLVEDWEDRNPECRYSVSIDVDEDTLRDALTHATYRIVSEGLTNIGKHAKATSAELVVRDTTTHQRHFLEISIIDNGIGLPHGTNSQRRGYGLNSIRERVVSLGGSYTTESVPNVETKIFIKIPIDD